MKKSKKIFAIITAAALAVSVAGCGGSTENTSGGSASAATAESAESSTAESTAAADETSGGVKETLPSVTVDDADTLISFTDEGTDIEGSGAEADGTVVTVTGAGIYALSGSTKAGQVIVDAGDDDTVTLILDNLDITNEDDEAVYIKNAKLAGIVMADGSDNRIQSGAEKEIDLSAKNSSDEDASGGALRAKCDMEITGNGTLSVYGYINNGIQSSDNITINGGTIEVAAINHGIKGNDSVTVNDGDITVTAMQDGIHSDGSVYIAGGRMTIATADDGIHADDELTIEDGTIDITQSYEGLEADIVLLAGGVVNVVSSDDGINATDGQSGGFGFGGMGPGNFELPEGFELPDDIEALREQILSGELELPEGFEMPGGRGGMNGDGSEMPEGMPEGFGGRDGMDRGDMQSRQGGFGGRGGMNGDGSEMPEGFEDREGMPGGDMQDRQGGFGGRGGMNGDGSDMPEGFEDRQGAFGGFGGMQDVDKDSLPVIRITGGTITVDAGGDGIDSNGNLYVEGGLVIVNGPTSGANGALDYGSENGGECLVTGGTVLAFGSSGMAETFGSDSTQCSFICNLSSSFDEGDTLTITAEDGTVLFEQEIKKKGSSVVFSSPDLKVGDTVTLTVGDETQEISLDSISTSVGDRGFGSFGGFGGMGGRGGADREDFGRMSIN